MSKVLSVDLRVRVLFMGAEGTSHRVVEAWHDRPINRRAFEIYSERVLSGIVYVIRHGWQWKDETSGYGPHKTLYNRFIRWSRLGVFARIFFALTGNSGVPEELMIDSTHLKAHRTTASLQKKRVLRVGSDAQEAD